ncbi:MAG: PVC-type heme-binding CxxCH protein [Opitutaceae bacterium]
MNFRPFLSLLALFVVAGLGLQAQPALRVYIRSGPKTHGPGAHDHPRFLAEWTALLQERGAVAKGGPTFPSAAELEQTDVLILNAPEAGNIAIGDERNALDAFLKRGGGLVVIHAAAVSRDPDWYKTIIGGSWRFGTTKWLEGPMHLYFTDRTHPITTGASNWSMEDEIYYDMEMLPEARVLAAAYTPKATGARNEGAQKRANELTGGGKKVSIYDVQPQMWTYERTVVGGTKAYRAFVSLPGHYHVTYNRINYRALLLRGIAWAGQLANPDALCRPEELGDALRYVEGGPTAPAAAAATIELHPEFTLNLVAAEPLINKVMNLDWDEKGRLWVNETPEYPNGRRVPNTTPWKDSGSLYPQRQDRDPEDRISILSDTNGDGRMDRKTVFADKLELATSFCFYRNGVIVASAPDIWFLEDTNGDDIADKRTRLYTGLGIADTHAVINNLRWGLDGWIYATHGYSRGDVTSPDGKIAFGAAGSGVVRFKPDGSAFEQYSSRGGNTWGLDITWDGQVLWTQPTSGTVFFHTVLPESILARGKIPGTPSWKGMIVGQRTYPLMTWPEQAYVQIDQVGRFTAAAGCAIYDGGAWPERWNGSYFTGEPTLNIVHHQFTRRDGVSFTTEKEKGREETEFMRSRDLWFRPIETRIGPDGALYVVDFYNQAVIHNDTRGPQHGPANAAVRPDRDHYFARIWRVQHQQARTLPPLQLDRTNLAGLTNAIQTSPNAHVRQIAWRLARENHPTAAVLASLARPMGSPAERTYERIRGATTPEARQAALDTFLTATDDWTRSAVIAGAADHGTEFVLAALRDPRAAELTPFVAGVLPSALPAGAASLLEACASSTPRSIALTTLVLRELAGVKVAPTLTDSGTAALRTLLDRPDTTVAALPLGVLWDPSGTLRSRTDSLTQTFLQKLAAPGTADAERLGVATSLLALPARRADTLARVEALLSDSATPATLKSPLIATLGTVSGPDVGTALASIWSRTRSAPVFDQILRRPEFATALLDALKEGRIAATVLSPGDAARLRTHPNRQVARNASALLAKLNPQTQEKDVLIARLTPEVEKPGDFAKGRALFAAACAVCHRYNDVGLVDIGPPLSGMGAHGPASLLQHILDPNREVDPSFWQWNVTTKKGETLVGVIVSESATGLTLRSLGGDHEVKTEDIATRENTRRSLMPEGFEGIGSEGLRDLLTYLCSGDQGYRVLDLREAYTANSRRGLFSREDLPEESFGLHRLGSVMVEGVPFFVMDSAKSPNGRNVVALKGGPGTSHASEDYPQRVTIPVNVPTSRLHFLGGLAGGAWPVGGDAARGLPAMNVVVAFADGTREEHVLKNGIHFAAYNTAQDLPEARDAGDFTQRGKLRVFSIPLTKTGLVTHIELESFDNDLVPCTVAVTAQLAPATASSGTAPTSASTPAAAAASAAVPTTGPREGGKGDRPLPETQPVVWEAGKTRVLIIGGGSSHDFAAFFGGTDSATLRAAGFSVHYTEDRDQAAAELARADVAVISVNRKFFDTPEYRKALHAFAEAGKGIVMLHPGTWYGYAQWPELNAEIVGGGARGHDRMGPFEVKAVKPTHPILQGVPASFEVEDELYYFNAESDKIPAGTAAIEVLAETSPSQKYQRPHPAVWVTRHPKARIVGITLGHDQRVHDLAPFKTLLTNAVRWTKSN